MVSGDDGEFICALTESVAGLGLASLTMLQLEQMRLHYELLTKWNTRMNLTRISAPRDAARLHYAESIYGSAFLSGAASALDVGSGAGFPAVPLAIMNSRLSVAALESNQKKSVFLKEVKQLLGLSNLHVETARIEDYNWSRYSALVSRAIDRAEKTYTALIQSLSPGQLLMLFCSERLLENLERELPPGIRVDRHRIPNSQSRFIAVINGLLANH